MPALASVSSSALSSLYCSGSCHGKQALDLLFVTFLFATLIDVENFPTMGVGEKLLVLGAVALAMWVGDLPHAANAEAGRLSQVQPETGPVNEPLVILLSGQARHLAL